MGGSSSKKEADKEEETKKRDKKNEKRVDEGIINAPPIPERASDKLYNSIVRINFEADEKKIIGTGFFIKLNLKNKTRHFLMTCHHVIQEKFVKEKISIKLYYGKYNEEKNFEIKLNRDKR